MKEMEIIILPGLRRQSCPAESNDRVYKSWTFALVSCGELEDLFYTPLFFLNLPNYNSFSTQNVAFAICSCFGLLGPSSQRRLD
jgi:hypothetical protein